MRNAHMGNERDYSNKVKKMEGGVTELEVLTSTIVIVKFGKEL